ncbi:MAG: alpha/beta hydrolase [Gammaproteobacteria bacterium]
MLETVEINPKSGEAEFSIIWMHGLGADGYDFASIVPQLKIPDSLGVRFIFPHAPIRPITFAGGERMRAWFDLKGLNADAASGDEKGVKESEKLIIELIENEIARGIPSQNIILAGFSQGGAMTLYTGLRYPKPLAGMLVLSGFLLFASKLPTEKNSANDKTPILMLHGSEDNMVPIVWAKSSYKNLKDLGLNITWQDYPMPHSVCDKEIQDIATWLQKVLDR